MAKNKKQKKVAWVKMPVCLLDDERMAELVAQKGMAGLGVYIAIICEMYHRQCQSLTLTQVREMRFKGATPKTVMDILEEYGLFRKDRMGHICSAIDYIGHGEDVDVPSDSNHIAIGLETPAFPTPAREYIDRDKDKDHHIDGDDAGAGGGVDYIGMIPQQSEWTMMALMKSGFGSLIMRHWPRAIELFRQHTLVNLTQGSIRSVEDAKRYFYYYITHPTSGAMLRQALQEADDQHRHEGQYRHEDADSQPGHRTYHGIPLPDDAPPRPGDRAEWDFENSCWVGIN